MLDWRRGLRVAAMVVGVLSIAGPVAAQSVGEAPTRAPGAERSFAPPPGALIAPGETPQLTLLYTGNVVGYLDPCG